MKHLILSTAIAMSTTAVGAATITVDPFSPADFDALTSSDGAVIEDFEMSSGEPEFVGFVDADATEGELAGPLTTKVGTFASLGGSGSGSTCDANSVSGTCSQIALEQDTINGQGNLLPTDGEWAVSSNDTLGVSWLAKLDSGKLFNQVIFTLRDAVDRSDELSLAISTSEGGLFTIFGRQPNDTQQIVVIDFLGNGVSEVTIDIALNANKPDDGFTIDGATLIATPVPLPASALLLIGGVGAIGLMRRRRRAFT